MLKLGSLGPWGCEKKRRPEKRGPGEKVVKLLAGGKMLEVREDPEDHVTGWRQLLWSPRVLG